jgi:hypothetical protein
VLRSPRVVCWLFLVLTSVCVAACGRAREEGSSRAITQPPERDLAPSGCPAASHWNPHVAVCQPDPAGPPRGQHASGALRFTRAPLVQLFPRDDVLWLTYRLNGRPQGFVTTMLDDTTVIFQNENGLGYERASLRGHCYAQSVDQSPESFGRSLRHPHVGQRVRVALRVDDRSHSRIVMSTRIRHGLPRDSPDVGGWGWMEALGCRSGLTIGD